MRPVVLEAPQVPEVDAGLGVAEGEGGPGVEGLRGEGEAHEHEVGVGGGELEDAGEPLWWVSFLW